MVGGGGHCKSVIEAALGSGWEIKGILDTPDKVGSKCLGFDIIGTDEDIPLFVEECQFVVTLGFIKDPRHRVELHKRIVGQGGQLATIIASTANVSEYAHIGEGTVVLHNACVNAGAEIGMSCIVNTLSNIEHDVKVGDFTHVSTGVMVNGDCKIGKGTFIGSGSVIVNEKQVGDNVVIGAGCLVCTDLTEQGTYYGVPAKRQ